MYSGVFGLSRGSCIWGNWFGLSILYEISILTYLTKLNACIFNLTYVYDYLMNL